MLVSLATLATVYSTYVANSAIALSVNDERLKSAAAVSGALELVAYRLSGAAATLRPTRGGFGVRIGKSDVQVQFVSEAARIDLNAAPKEVLAGLVSVW